MAINVSRLSEQAVSQKRISLKNEVPLCANTFIKLNVKRRKRREKINIGMGFRD
jgi:hypothetical protein